MFSGKSKKSSLSPILDQAHVPHMPGLKVRDNLHFFLRRNVQNCSSCVVSFLFFFQCKYKRNVPCQCLAISSHASSLTLLISEYFDMLHGCFILTSAYTDLMLHVFFFCKQVPCLLWNEKRCELLTTISYKSNGKDSLQACAPLSLQPWFNSSQLHCSNFSHWLADKMVLLCTSRKQNANIHFW